MYVNHRRGATESVRLQPTKQERYDAFSAERKKLVKDLTALELVALHKDFVTSNNETEADTFLVLQCEADKFQGRASSETDTAPRLIAKSLVSLNNVNGSTQFCVPVQVVGSPAWRFLVPRFGEWLLSGCRYASWDQTKNQLIPNKTAGDQIKEIGTNDILEVYYGALSGTIGEFWRTGEKETAQNVYRLLHTLRLIMNDLQGSNVTFEHFVKTVNERDESREKAIAFKTMMTKTHPTCISTHLLRAIKENADILHKSRFMNLDSIFLGWMTLPFDQHPFASVVAAAPMTAAKDAKEPKDAKDGKKMEISPTTATATGSGSAGSPVTANAPVAPTDVMDHVLRAILERTMKDVCYKNVSQYVEKDKLIQFLQESVGKNVEKRLQFWAYFLSVLRDLILGPVCSSRSFVERLTNLRKTIFEFRGGLAGICLLIAPRLALQDQDLAEVILMTAETSADEKKFATLRFSAIGQTPKLDAILQDNAKRIEEKQAAAKKLQEDLAKDASVTAANAAASIALATAAAADGKSAEAAPPKIVQDPKRKWVEFYQHGFQHAGDIPTLDRYITLVYTIANQGTDLELLQETIRQGAAKKILGLRRAIQLVVLSKPPAGTPIHAHYKDIAQTQMKKRDKIASVLRDLHVNVPSTQKSSASAGSAGSKALENELKQEVVVPASFVKFAVARELTKEAKLAIEALHGQGTFECAICLTISKSLPEVLHGDTRHIVCRKCITTIGKECPFCRAPLGKNSAAAASAAIVAPDAAAGKKGF